jgi:hypothetical protein
LPMTAGAAVAEEEAGDPVLAGTQFNACTQAAWASYNSCLRNASFGWERALCDLAFEADVVFCGAVYYRTVKSGT